MMSWELELGKTFEIDPELEIEYLENLVGWAKERKLKIDGLYDDPIMCESGKVQEQLRYSTMELFRKFNGMEIWNRADVDQGDLDDALPVMDDIRKLYGKHPYREVIFGRMVVMATSASKTGLKVPSKYRSYVGRKLESWQEPTWNYSTPGDFGHSPEKVAEGLAPEWRF